MLVKLLKYEIKATGRVLLPLYAAVIIMSIINRLFIGASSHIMNAVSGLMIFIYIALILVSAVVTFVIIIQRFYKNLLGDEGYLMHTLPTTVSANVLSKTIVAACWTVVNATVIILSVFILVVGLSETAEIMNDLFVGFSYLNQAMGSLSGLIYFEMIALIIVSIVSSMLMIYASISLGQLVVNHKLLGSFGAYLGLSMVNQIFGSILISIFSPMITPTTITVSIVVQTMAWILGGMTVYMIVGGIACYFVTQYMMSTKLNLE